MPTARQWRDYRRYRALGYDTFCVPGDDTNAPITPGWTELRIEAALAALDEDPMYPYGKCDAPQQKHNPAVAGNQCVTSITIAHRARLIQLITK